MKQWLRYKVAIEGDEAEEPLELEGVNFRSLFKLSLETISVLIWIEEMSEKSHTCIHYLTRVKVELDVNVILLCCLVGTSWTESVPVWLSQC